jgi:tRNA-guanine family transglycosylase
VCSQGFSRAYLRHLYVAGEILAHRLLSLHNLHTYASLMASARKAISEGQIERWVHDMSSLSTVERENEDAVDGLDAEPPRA